MQILTAVGVVLALLVQPPRTVKGRYRHPGQGFSVMVPQNATGLLEGVPEVERGIRMKLASGGSIYVFGEPNSLEWPTPAVGVRWAMELHEECARGRVSPAMVGKLSGAGGRVSCGAEVVVYRLAFRPKGGPIYWLRLETDGKHELEDGKVLEEVSASFRTIRWE